MAHRPEELPGTLGELRASGWASVPVKEEIRANAVRKIEREVGSVYKVNGKNVRMRDVQLLFADSSIGAHSPALVSQGRVADMINAKPTQRRMVLASKPR